MRPILARELPSVSVGESQSANKSVLWTAALAPVAALGIAGLIAYYIIKTEPARKAGNTLF